MSTSKQNNNFDILAFCRAVSPIRVTGTNLNSEILGQIMGRFQKIPQLAAK